MIILMMELTDRIIYNNKIEIVILMGYQYYSIGNSMMMAASLVRSNNRLTSMTVRQFILLQFCQGHAGVITLLRPQNQCKHMELMNFIQHHRDHVTLETRSLHVPPSPSF